MFCRKCGKQIPDDSVFCVNCGTPVISDDTQRAENTDNTIVNKESKPKQRKVWLYAFAGLAALIILAGVIFLIVIISQQNKIKKMESEMNEVAKQRAAMLEEQLVSATPTPTLMPTPTIIEEYAPDYQNGYIIFGEYEQDNDISNGREPIEWIFVKQCDDDTYMFMSRYVLESLTYNKDILGETWDKSSLREWLNNDFYYSAFTNEERECIVEKNNHTNDNPKYGTSGGEDTIDKVFCLSIDDLVDAFGYRYYAFNEAPGSDVYMAEQTPYIENNPKKELQYEEVYSYSRVIDTWGYPSQCIGMKPCMYWLRDTGGEGGQNAVYMDMEGVVNYYGYPKYEPDTYNNWRGVRPALCIRIKDASIADKLLKDNIGRKAESSTVTPAIQNTDNEVVSEQNDIRPNVKEAIDSYEDFIDSYCDFMKSYDSSDWTTLTKYGEFMSQYYETTEKFDAIADMDLNDAESLYYAEVSLRCSEKMLKIAYDLK